MSVSVPIGERPGSYWEQCMPTEPPVHCITEVPFDKWVSEGVIALVLDVEAHLGATGAKDLDPKRLAAVHRARETGIEHVALSTNKRVETNEDRYLLRGWSEQAGADLTLYPQQPEQRKPSPYMIFQAMKFFDISADQIGSSGDKASADVRAAYLAGVKHRAWTQPMNGNRHPGDRYVRSSFESVLRVVAHLQLTPKLQKEPIIGIDALTNLESVLDPAVISVMESGQADGLDNIAGLGIAEIMLDPEMLAAIRQPKFRQTLDSLKDIYDHYGELPKESLKTFMYEHGRSAADGLVFLRLLSALGIAAVSLSDVPEDLKSKIITGLAAAAYPSDIADGIFARLHKFGATKKGGAYDQNVDKILATVIDVFPLINRELISKPDVCITLIREIGLTAARRPFKQRGISTSSVMSGKIAQWSKGGAQIFSLTLGQRYSLLNQTLQHTATAAKVGSAVHAPFAWIKAHEQLQHDRTEEELKQILGEAVLIATL